MSSEQIILLLAPLILLQVGLQIFGIIDLLKKEREVKGDNKIVWGLVIVAGNLLGVAIYFLAGRKEA